MRESFEKYGATAFLNAEQELVKIFHCHENKMVYPSDGIAWKRAKFAYR